MCHFIQYPLQSLAWSYYFWFWSDRRHKVDITRRQWIAGWAA